jgi:hypothetical protein
MSNDSADIIEKLKQAQKPHIGGTRTEPFLTDPASFRSKRSPGEINQSQKDQLVAAPTPKRTPAVMDLAEVIGSDGVTAIQNNGQIVFHAAGDTGAGQHEDLGQVASVMAMDYHRPNPADRPSFFLHLGDVTYNQVFPQSKKDLYPPQFYVPYSNYPGKILAIPGNHDSNPEEDQNSIKVFQDNFCADLPTPQQLAALVQSPTRTPMYQPGVFFRLDAPFVQILALFSNGGEHEGVIRGGVVGDEQWTFLGKQLAEIKTARDNGQRRAFLLAIHHPPYSGGGGHTGSGQMLKDLDEAFNTAGIAPDAVLSGHAHIYQRFTRTVTVGGKTMQVPYIVAGCGGHNITPMKPASNRHPVSTPLLGKKDSNDPTEHVLNQYFNGFGHMMVTVTNQVVTLDFIGTKTNSGVPVDSVTVLLSSNQITHETAPFAHPANGEQETKHVSSP